MMRVSLFGALALILSGTASAQFQWPLKIERKPPPPIEESEQFQGVSAGLERIFTAHHLAKPYPRVVIVEPNAEVLKVKVRFGHRFKPVNVTGFGSEDRVIYVSRLFLTQAPRAVIEHIEHAVVHFHVLEHHQGVARWHDHYFDFFCAEAGFEQSCRRHSCSHPRAEKWPDQPQNVHTPSIQNGPESDGSARQK